MKYNVLTD